MSIIRPINGGTPYNLKTMPKVLITRAQEDAEETAKLLAEEGVESLICPIFAIERLNPQETTADIIVVTSRNAVFAAGAGATVLAGGKATLASCRKAGIGGASLAGETAHETLEYILGNFAPGEKSFCHLSGEEITVDIAARLAEKGFTATRRIVYRARYIDELPEFASAAIRNGEISEIPLFSENAASALVKLIKKSGLEKECAGIRISAISEKVAKVAEGVRWKGVVVRTS